MTPKDKAVAAVVELNTTTPPSFGGDMTLYALNLCVMTTLFFYGVMFLGRQLGRVWRQRFVDHPLDPVSIYRAITIFASAGLTLRAGAEAMLLWGWNPDDAVTTARVLMAKRWIDPLSGFCAVMWMMLAMLGEPGMEHQLRKAPLPVDMWSRWPVLARAALVAAIGGIASFAAVALR